MMEKENVEVLDIEDTTTLDKIELPQENTLNSTAPEIEQESTNSSTPQPPQEILVNKLPKYDGYRNKIVRYSIFLVLSLLSLFFVCIYYNSISNQISNYTENANVSYQVCLSENNYYNEQCLGENLEYISEITDVVKADFGYTVLYQTTTNKKFKYHVESKLVFQTSDDDAKELLTKTKKLTKTKEATLDKNFLNIAEVVDIPFKEYNEYAEKYKSDYSLLSSANLVVSLVIEDGNKKTEVSSLTLPLTKLTYNISKKELTNKTTDYEIDNKSILPIILIMSILICIIFISLSIIKIMKFLWKTRNKKTPYEKKLKQILNTYDRVIITLEDKNTIVNDKEVYKVKSFLELLDVRDTIDKPILYYKVNNIKTEFYVQDIDKTYKFTMKESDFEDSK